MGRRAGQLEDFVSGGEAARTWPRRRQRRSSRTTPTASTRAPHLRSDVKAPRVVRCAWRVTRPALARGCRPIGQRQRGSAQSRYEPSSPWSGRPCSRAAGCLGRPALVGRASRCLKQISHRSPRLCNFLRLFRRSLFAGASGMLTHSMNAAHRLQLTRQGARAERLNRPARPSSSTRPAMERLWSRAAATGGSRSQVGQSAEPVGCTNSITSGGDRWLEAG